jgi:hypothetical protein
MITYTEFNKIVKSIKNYNKLVRKNDESIDETDHNKDILLVHQYIEENKISNNKSLYKVFYDFAYEHSFIYYFWDEYLMNNRDNPTMKQYINKKFLKNADKEQSFIDIKDNRREYDEETFLAVITLRKILLALSKPIEEADTEEATPKEAKVSVEAKVSKTCEKTKTITDTEFEGIIESIRNYNTVGCKEDEDMLEVESKHDKNVLLAYNHIKKNKISNNESLYKVFYDFACEHSSIYYFWTEYLKNNRNDLTIQEYVDKKFLKNTDKSQSFTNIKDYEGHKKEALLNLITLRKTLLALK